MHLLREREREKGGQTDTRGGRRPQKGILLDGLEGESAQEPGGDAGGRVLWAIVDVHGGHEEGNVGHHEGRYQPRCPPLERPELPAAKRACRGGQPRHRRRR